MAKVEHHVKIGKIRVAGDGEILKTVLGSCVGIALIWRRRSKCALAHCLLPVADVKNVTASGPARYVDQTIPRMLEQLGALPEDLHELEAVIAGGGQMMEVEQPYTKFIVGEENLKTAKKCLEQHRIRMIACEPGGMQGTKMSVDCGTGAFEIEKIPKAA